MEQWNPSELQWIGMSRSGYLQTFRGVSHHVRFTPDTRPSRPSEAVGSKSGIDRLQIRKATFEPIAAAHNDLFICYISFAISKWKKLASQDFGAY